MANRRSIIRAVAFTMAASCPIGAASACAEEEATPAALCCECRTRTARQYPRLDEHVRSAQPEVVTRIRDGLGRSATFNELMAFLDGSDVVAYVELGYRMPSGLEGYLAHSVLASGGRRYLRIFVDIGLQHDRSIEIIAHELQHATEVAIARDVKSDGDMQKLFKRLDSGRCQRRCAETDAAVDVQRTVSRELRGQRGIVPAIAVEGRETALCTAEH
jgi:hypothetical protein